MKAAAHLHTSAFTQTLHRTLFAASNCTRLARLHAPRHQLCSPALTRLISLPPSHLRLRLMSSLTAFFKPVEAPSAKQKKEAAAAAAATASRQRSPHTE